MKRFLLFTPFLVTVMAIGTAHAADKPGETKSEKEFILREAGTLHLKFPANWEVVPSQSAKSGILTERFKFYRRPDTNLVGAMQILNLGADKTRLFNIRKNLEDAAHAETPHASGNNFVITDISGPETSGAYFFATDESVPASDPKPGSFRYCTRGYVKLRTVICEFRSLSNRTNDDNTTALLEVVKSARLTPPQ